MNFPELKNTLFLDVLNGNSGQRPPVWMMRQAGRFLPEYRELQQKYTFFERVKTPELACEITLQPINRLGVDAAIIFSDILVLLECLSINVELKPGFGPLITNPVQNAEDAKRIKVKSTAETLGYMYEALTLTRNTLDGRVPLIGFAGAPWTLFCYLVEGQGSKTFSKAKAFLFSENEEALKILDLITELTIQYLHEQVRAGAQALQVFDSWAAALSPDDYKKFILPGIKKICEEDYGVPMIMFAKDAEWVYSELKTSNVSAFGIGWGCTPENASLYAGNKVVQGNFDPSRLLSPPKVIEHETIKMINRFGVENYIANLGHGIIPEIPVEHAQVFIDTIKNYSSK